MCIYWDSICSHYYHRNNKRHTSTSKHTLMSHEHTCTAVNNHTTCWSCPLITARGPPNYQSRPRPVVQTPDPKLRIFDSPMDKTRAPNLSTNQKREAHTSRYILDSNWDREFTLENNSELENNTALRYKILSPNFDQSHRHYWHASDLSSLSKQHFP